MGFSFWDRNSRHRIQPPTTRPNGTSAQDSAASSFRRHSEAHSEGKTLEFKRDLSSPDGFLGTVIAFANTSGGVVLVGVEDRTRHVRGVPDSFALEERIANLVNDSIAPRLLPDIEVTLDDVDQTIVDMLEYFSLWL